MLCVQLFAAEIKDVDQKITTTQQVSRFVWSRLCGIVDVSLLAHERDRGLEKDIRIEQRLKEISENF